MGEPVDRVFKNVLFKKRYRLSYTFIYQEQDLYVFKSILRLADFYIFEDKFETQSQISNIKKTYS